MRFAGILRYEAGQWLAYPASKGSRFTQRDRCIAPRQTTYHLFISVGNTLMISLDISLVSQAGFSCFSIHSKYPLPNTIHPGLSSSFGTLHLDNPSVHHTKAAGVRPTFLPARPVRAQTKYHSSMALSGKLRSTGISPAKRQPL
jgi:hypothetical protein